MGQHTIVAGYNATDEAADGLALARLLADATASDLLVTRVLPHDVGTPVADRGLQRTVREDVRQTRRAMIAALPDDSDSGSVAILPALEPGVARGLHGVARCHDAELLVVGSSHHSRIGRALLGGSAELVVDHSPCPVAIAPPSFRRAPRIEPERIGCAFDGTLSSIDALHVAIDLAHALRMPVCAITVAKPNLAATFLADAAAFAREWGGDEVQLESLALEGDPATALVEETNGGVGMLVIGSRGLGPLRRALLGSVSTQVLRATRCPLVVVPRRG